MWSTSQTFSPVFTPFGGGYLPEHRSEDTRGHLGAPEVRETIDFGAILAALRSAVSLR
jgi:hypothetical protein